MTSDPTTRIILDIAAPVARITLHNPPVNVIDLQMAEELHRGLAQIESRADISCVIFQGSGRGFSAGVDIKAHLPEQIHAMLTAFHAVIRAMVASRKVMVAVVRGTCLGGGAELAAVCDMVYTSRDALWGFPEITLGCYPPVAAVALPGLIGQKRASELILTGRRFTGNQAAEMGLATRSVAPEKLDATVARVISELQALSPAALAHAKKAMYGWDAIQFDKGLARAEKVYFEELISTADAREGIMAFIEKRTPTWTGN